MQIYGQSVGLAAILLTVPQGPHLNDFTNLVGDTDTTGTFNAAAIWVGPVSVPINKQHCLQINYPNDFKFTRSVEYKYVTNQKSNFTSLSYEYPKSKGDPYYPISTQHDKKILKLYNIEKKNLEKQGIFFAGRLAEYKYINTDEAVGIGLSLSKKILKKN